LGMWHVYFGFGMLDAGLCEYLIICLQALCERLCIWKFGLWNFDFG